MGTLQDWVFWVTGAVLAVAGVVLGVWALFCDRSRGRRRCPKCWYDMSAAVATVSDGREVFSCPECGRRVTHVRGLTRTRRHPLRAAVAVVVLGAAYASLRAPEWKRGGWTALVPTSVLVVIAPAGEPGIAAFGMRMSTRRLATLFAQGAPPGSKPSASDLLAEEVWSRLGEGSMWRWQSQYFVGRYLEESGQTLVQGLVVPDRWVAGRPLTVLVGGRVGSLPGQVRCAADRRDRSGRAVYLEPGPDGRSYSIALELRGPSGAFYGRTYALPVALVESPADLWKQLDSEEATRLVRRALDVRLMYSGDELLIVADDRGDSARWTPIYFGLAYRVELVLDGAVIARASGAAAWDHFVQKDRTGLDHTEWAPGARDRVLKSPERATFVVRADLDGAWDLYRAWPFNKTNAAVWAGSYEVPARIDYGGSGRAGP